MPATRRRTMTPRPETPTRRPAKATVPSSEEASRAGVALRPAKRSLRRHHAARMKRRAEHRLRVLFDFQEPDARTVGLHAATPKQCSCWMCGNPRRYFGELTFQELRRQS